MHAADAALAAATQMRRRELPAALACVLLFGGIGAAVLGGAYTVGWAGLMAAMLVADCRFYRWLEARGDEIPDNFTLGLAAWAFAQSAFFVLMPLALALSSAAAGLAAAMVLLVAAAVRVWGPSGVRGPWVNAAAMTPLGLALAGLPFVLALSGHTDWDAALILVIGGAALGAYVIEARTSADAGRGELLQLSDEMNASARSLLSTISALSSARLQARRQGVSSASVEPQQCAS